MTTPQLYERLASSLEGGCALTHLRINKFSCVLAEVKARPLDVGALGVGTLL